MTLFLFMHFIKIFQNSCGKSLASVCVWTFLMWNQNIQSLVYVIWYKRLLSIQKNMHLVLINANKKWKLIFRWWNIKSFSKLAGETNFGRRLGPLLWAIDFCWLSKIEYRFSSWYYELQSLSKLSFCFGGPR